MIRFQMQDKLSRAKCVVLALIALSGTYSLHPARAAAYAMEDTMRQTYDRYYQSSVAVSRYDYKSQGPFEAAIVLGQYNHYFAESFDLLDRIERIANDGKRTSAFEAGRETLLEASRVMSDRYFFHAKNAVDPNAWADAQSAKNMMAFKVASELHDRSLDELKTSAEGFRTALRESKSYPHRRGEDRGVDTAYDRLEAAYAAYADQQGSYLVLSEKQNIYNWLTGFNLKTGEARRTKAPKAVSRKQQTSQLPAYGAAKPVVGGYSAL